MPEPTTYSRMTLKFTSPFAKYGESAHLWSIKFALSGAEITVQATADAVAQDLADGCRALATSETSFIGWLYYPPGGHVNTLSADYDSGTYPGTRSAYTDPTGAAEQLEVCALLRCPVGRNSLGRSKYLFKHLHDVTGGSAGEIAALIDFDTTFAAWQTGAGPDSVVPVDPTTGVQGGPWTIHPALYTRQLRRGQKKA